MISILEPTVELVWVTPDPAKVIEFGARTCYANRDQHDPARTAEYLDRVVHQRHHVSVTEHACACFDVMCDRGVMAEATRHRHHSFSVESTRYCNYSKEKFAGLTLIPMMDGLTQEQIDRRLLLYNMMETVYLQEVEEGVSPQQARDNLPTCLMTRMRVTANFSAWMHFLTLRTDKSAHPQIRKIAGMIRVILQKECPEIFGSNLASEAK